jgi:hypothetical protein
MLISYPLRRTRARTSHRDQMQILVCSFIDRDIQMPRNERIEHCSRFRTLNGASVKILRGHAGRRLVFLVVDGSERAWLLTSLRRTKGRSLCNLSVGTTMERGDESFADFETSGTRMQFGRCRFYVRDHHFCCHRDGRACCY